MSRTPRPDQGPIDDITFRRPVEADYPSLVRVIDDWWGGRNMDFLLPRLWLQHFTGTSWLAETADGALLNTSPPTSTLASAPPSADLVR